MSLKDIQKKLIAKGYNPGHIDGLWGPRTEAALSQVIDAAPKIIVSEDLTQRELDMHPELLKRWTKAKNLWNAAHDTEAICTCSYRSFEAQDALYDQGRTRPGPIVTNAQAGESIHNYLPAIACDVGFIKSDGSLDWSEDLFKQFAKIFKPLGLEWGGDWVTFIDMPHFQATGASWRKLQNGEVYQWA